MSFAGVYFYKLHVTHTGKHLAFNMAHTALRVVGRSDLESIFRLRDVQMFRRIVSFTATESMDLRDMASLAAAVAVQLGLPAFT